MPSPHPHQPLEDAEKPHTVEEDPDTSLPIESLLRILYEAATTKKEPAQPLYWIKAKERAAKYDAATRKLEEFANTERILEEKMKNMQIPQKRTYEATWIAMDIVDELIYERVLEMPPLILGK